MKVIKNRFIPFPGFLAMNFFGILLVRSEWQITEVGFRHERIHTLQMKEMLYVFFYLWYLTEWLFRLIQYRNLKKAYRNISFEREAYMHQTDLNYESSRKIFSSLKYLKI